MCAEINVCTTCFIVAAQEHESNCSTFLAHGPCLQRYGRGGTSTGRIPKFTTPTPDWGTL